MVFSRTLTMLMAWLGAALLLAGNTSAETPSDANGEIILVVGAGGTDQYAKQFSKWADRWRQVAEKSEVQLTFIGPGQADQTPDRERLEKAIQGASAKRGGPLWIVLIGHGTFANKIAKFNLRGRDFSASELADWLAPIQRPVVVIDCSSSSGPFINRLSAKNRVIVTATMSGVQQNYARFGQYFSEAISSPSSDLDHDDEVSVHEAFLQASAGVKQFYESEARISTEQALIDDNGDGRGTPAKMFRGTRPIAKAKDGSDLDGKFASRITLSPTRFRLSLTADEVAERAEIEQQLDQLRQKKDVLSEA
ncbi:MAG: hypothetical protein MI861_14070, partial [Pirellulales bacterium]|nr:hypothetical protein [Pirellulales bacterium]